MLCLLKAFRKKVLKPIKDYTIKLALELDVVGLMNIQYAVKTDGKPKVYIIRGQSPCKSNSSICKVKQWEYRLQNSGQIDDGH